MDHGSLSHAMKRRCSQQEGTQPQINPWWSQAHHYSEVRVEKCLMMVHMAQSPSLKQFLAPLALGPRPSPVKYLEHSPETSFSNQIDFSSALKRWCLPGCGCKLNGGFGIDALYFAARLAACSMDLALFSLAFTAASAFFCASLRMPALFFSAAPVI